jgi:hypothetical protein
MSLCLHEIWSSNTLRELELILDPCNPYYYRNLEEKKKKKKKYIYIYIYTHVRDI